MIQLEYRNIEDLSVPDTIRQVVITKAGGFDVLKIRERARFTPGPGEVSIQVKAAGINFADIMPRPASEEISRLASTRMAPLLIVSALIIPGFFSRSVAVQKKV